jgi:hypothetical protein
MIAFTRRPRWFSQPFSLLVTALPATDGGADPAGGAASGTVTVNGKTTKVAYACAVGSGVLRQGYGAPAAQSGRPAFLRPLARIAKCFGWRIGSQSARFETRSAGSSRRKSAIARAAGS